VELYLIRHGQSTNNALELESERTYDPQLTALGHQQAAYLATFATEAAHRDPWINHETGFSRSEARQGLDLTHLYVSPMHRTLQTASPLARALGMKPIIRYDIYEHGGIYLEQDGVVIPHPGRSLAQVAEEFPDYVPGDGHREDGWYDIRNGQESYPQACARAITLVMELRTRAVGEDREARIGIVTHGTFMDIVLKAFFGMLPTRVMYHMHYNTAITRLDFMDKDRLLLRYVNRVDHLPAEAIS